MGLFGGKRHSASRAGADDVRPFESNDNDCVKKPRVDADGQGAK